MAKHHPLGWGRGGGWVGKMDPGSLQRTGIKKAGYAGLLAIPALGAEMGGFLGLPVVSLA